MTSGTAEQRRAYESAHTNRREFLIAAAAVGTAVTSATLGWQFGHGNKSPARLHDQIIPSAVGRWSRSNDDSVFIPRGIDPGEEVYDDVMTAYYTSRAAPSVMLLIAYGSAQTGLTQIHRPEVCYPATGFRIHGSHEILLRILPGAPLTAREMTATAPGRIEQILYWSRVGPEFPTSNIAQRWAVLRHTMSGAVPDGALVRMSLIDPDPALGSTVLVDFAAALVKSAGSSLLRLIVGRA